VAQPLLKLCFTVFQNIVLKYHRRRQYARSKLCYI
jgi:hypothetical protein